MVKKIETGRKKAKKWLLYPVRLQTLLPANKRPEISMLYNIQTVVGDTEIERGDLISERLKISMANHSKGICLLQLRLQRRQK